MWETGHQAEALLTEPGFKPHTTPKGQASHFNGQEHSTHVHPLVLGAIVQYGLKLNHNAGRDGRDSLHRTRLQGHMLV